MGFATMRLLAISASLTVLLGGSVTSNQPAMRPPIIDMHTHAYAAGNWKGPSPNPVTGKRESATADEHMRQTLAVMTEYHIVKAVVSGPLDAVE
jgi:cytosine/adenosine deaminase-related metal-dependent hydrolase